MDKSLLWIPTALMSLLHALILLNLEISTLWYLLLASFVFYTLGAIALFAVWIKRL